MTRTAVKGTFARVRAWIRAGNGNATLDDIEALRHHEEAQAAELERLTRECDSANKLLIERHGYSKRQLSENRCEGREMSSLWPDGGWSYESGRRECVVCWEGHPDDPDGGGHLLDCPFGLSERLRTAALAHNAEIDCGMTEIKRLKAALVAAAEHHEEQADLWNSDNEFGDDETGEYHAERARVLRAAAEGQS